MSNTTLVNVDADTALKLVEFVGDISNDEGFKSECHAFVEKGDGAELVRRLLSKEKDIFAMEEELDIEGCFMTIASILLIFGIESDDLIRKFISVLSAAKGEDGKVFLRLKLLTTLFNMLSSPEARNTVMCSILNYALETNQESEVMSFVSKVDEYIKKWALDSAKNQELAFLAYKVAKKYSDNHDNNGVGLIGGTSVGNASSKIASSLKFLISYLKCFPQGSVLPDSAVSATVYHLVEVLKSSASASFDQRSALLEVLQSSAAASSGEPLKPLLELLKIISTGNSDDFETFSKANANTFQEHGLDKEEMANTMRLLVLSTLASSKSKLSYGEIASALSIDEETVELVVVEAVAQGFIEATMDQFEQSITVTKCARRTISPSEWVELSDRLKQLRANVGSVLEEIKQNKSS